MLIWLRPLLGQILSEQPRLSQDPISFLTRGPAAVASFESSQSKR